MLKLDELQYLVAFKDLETLNRVSEKYNISAPSITRAMKNIEQELNVTLFIRNKNKIELNKVGLRTVEYARTLLQNAQNAVADIRAYDQSLRTITVKSCAPMPLWDLVPRLSSANPNMTISSSICHTEQVLSALNDGTSDIGILPYELRDASFNVQYYDSEALFICVKKEHELSKRESVSFQDINGYNFLLMSQLGFWDSLCKEKMPSSKFLVQTDAFEFEELVRNSSLPSFITDKTAITAARKDYAIIPITDPEATVHFYTVSLKGSSFKML